MSLFDRLTTRFKADYELVELYLRVCVQINSHRNFYRVFVRSVKRFSNSLSLWLICAYFEFEVRHNPIKARKIFQKALLTNKGNSDFWIEYILLEIEILKLYSERKNVINKIKSNVENNEVNQPAVLTEEKEKPDNSDLEEEEEEIMLSFDESNQNAQLGEAFDMDSNRVFDNIIDQCKLKCKEFDSFCVKLTKIIQITDEISSFDNVIFTEIKESLIRHGYLIQDSDKFQKETPKKSIKRALNKSSINQEVLSNFGELSDKNKLDLISLLEPSNFQKEEDFKLFMEKNIKDYILIDLVIGYYIRYKPESEIEIKQIFNNCKRAIKMNPPYKEMIEANYQKAKARYFQFTLNNCKDFEELSSKIDELVKFCNLEASDLSILFEAIVSSKAFDLENFKNSIIPKFHQLKNLCPSEILIQIMQLCPNEIPRTESIYTSSNDFLVWKEIISYYWVIRHREKINYLLALAKIKLTKEDAPKLAEYYNEIKMKIAN